jgi:hypothetical protein
MPWGVNSARKKNEWLIPAGELRAAAKKAHAHSGCVRLWDQPHDPCPQVHPGHTDHVWMGGHVHINQVCVICGVTKVAMTP